MRIYLSTSFCKKRNVVLSALDSARTTDSLNAGEIARPYSKSALEEKTDAIDSFIVSPYNNCSTDFWNYNICTVGKIALGFSRERLKRFLQKLLKFIRKTSLTSTDFNDHMYLL